MVRFVVCGETLIDLVLADEQPPGFMSSAWSALSAGGPMNTAVGLGRLGAEVQFLGRLSDDPFGRQLRGHIEAAGVGLDLSTGSRQATSLAVVSLDEQGKASYTFHFADTANFGWQAAELPTLASGDWLHIASLACVVGPGCDVLLDWAAGVPAGMSYDINVRPTVIADPGDYWARVEPWLRVVGRRGGIVKASDDDVSFLARAEFPDQDPADVLARWVERYEISMGVLTLGPHGAVAMTADGTRTAVPGIPTSLVDTVGAGDTFMAGFLEAAVGQGLEPRASLLRGVAASSIVCSRQGARPPTAAEVDALIDQVAASST